MRAAVTISLVSEAAGGPFVFWHDIPAAAARAAELGFDALEIFPPDADFPDRPKLDLALRQHSLSVAAMGTGAGWVKHKLTLTAVDGKVREQARQFVRSIIATAASYGAPAIVGSMQGRVEPGLNRSQSLAYFHDAVEELAEFAQSQGQVLLIEPLNRYETNILSNIQQGLDFLASLRTKNARLLLDLFHMNIEEQDLAASIRLAGPAVGHVHLADSNRRAAGFGHIDFPPIIAALREINYSGYLSAEVLPLPTSDAAAVQTIAAIKGLAR